jgi:hypothetical protein
MVTVPEVGSVDASSVAPSGLGGFDETAVDDEQPARRRQAGTAKE